MTDKIWFHLKVTTTCCGCQTHFLYILCFKICFLLCLFLYRKGKDIHCKCPSIFVRSNFKLYRLLAGKHFKAFHLDLGEMCEVSSAILPGYKSVILFLRWTISRFHILFPPYCIALLYTYFPCVYMETGAAWTRTMPGTPCPGLLFYFLHSKKISKIKSCIQPSNSWECMCILVKIKAVGFSIHDNCLFI